MDQIAAGTLLAGRYQVQEQVRNGADSSLWRAEDLTLERPVGVRVLAADHPRVQVALDAARRAALVDDSRLQRVLGVGMEAGNGYVVLEWVSGQDGTSLAGRVSEQEAVRLVRDTAEALRTAATRRLHHGRLGPREVVRASDGSVRVVGTGIDVAAAGPASPAAAAHPEARDVRDLSAVLFALLTGHWPYGALEGLPAAPTEAGHPVPARQLRGDVSAALSDLLAEVAAGRGPDTVAGLVDRLGALGDGTGTSAAAAPSLGAGSGVASAAGAGAAGVAGGGAPDDTDVIMVVRTPDPTSAPAPPAGDDAAVAAGAAAVGTAAAAAGTAAAGTAAAAPVAAAPVAAAPVAAAPVAAAPVAAAPVAASVARTAVPAAAAVTVPRVTPGAPAAPGAPAWQRTEPDDGWNLLPGGDDDRGYEAGYAPYDQGDPQAWDDQAGWFGDEAGWVDGDADDRVAPAVLPGGPRTPRRRSGAGTGVAVVVFVGALVVGGLVWALDGFEGDPAPVAQPSAPPVSEAPAPSAVPSVTEPSTAPTTPGPELITPAGVQALDPQGDGEENDQEAPRAIDGDPASAWSTQRYNSQPFGGLKTGLGLAFDLGSPRDVTAITVSAPGSGGTYEIRSATGPGFDGSTVVATGQTGDAAVEVVPAEVPVNTQFLLVWFTALPDNGGEWRAVVSEVQVQVQ